MCSCFSPPYLDPISCFTTAAGTPQNINTCRQKQFCGAAFISSGSGSSILGWIPIRIQGFKMTKIEKNYSWKKNLIVFGSKTTIYLSLGLHKGRSSYRRSLLKRGHATLQNMNINFFSTFVDHFCPPGSGSGFRIRIHWPDWIRIRNPGQKNKVVSLFQDHVRPSPLVKSEKIYYFILFYFSTIVRWFSSILPIYTDLYLDSLSSIVYTYAKRKSWHFWQKMPVFLLKPSIKNFSTWREGSSPPKRTSSFSKHNISSFVPLSSILAFLDPDANP